ncbi:MAG: substrate-binding domain-containing protein [Bryobacteraceae bacterium]|nr:substrate-binding domain-containing protein [Bryobacteraceae bacterium]
MRLRTLLLFALLSACAVFSCQHKSRRVVAVIPKATSHLFWLSVQAGAMAAGKEFNLDVLWNGPALETDYARQIQILDSMVARRVDGIAIAATERKALVQPVDRAIAAGIPVTVFDSGLDSSSFMCYIGTDNVEAGRMAARALGGMLGSKGTVAMVLHAPGSLSTMDREQGFKEVIGREFPNIKIVAEQYSMSNRAKAVAAAENILTAHPDLNGIFASTEPSASGVSLALKSRGMSGKVRFVAFDSSDTMIEDLKAGVIDATVVQDPFRMGFEAVKSLSDKLAGREPPKQLGLPARVVLADDLEKEEIQQLLSPDLRRYLK